MRCYACQLWPEAANQLGSTVESLLRVRYGSKGSFDDLVKKFDADQLFNSVILHDRVSKKCATCYADRARILRNSVHPDCWVEATQEDVGNTRMLVVLMYHVLVVCGGGIAVFQDAPHDTLKIMEASGIVLNDAAE